MENLWRQKLFVGGWPVDSTILPAPSAKKQGRPLPVKVAAS